MNRACEVQIRWVQMVVAVFMYELHMSRMKWHNICCVVTIQICTRLLEWYYVNHFISSLSSSFITSTNKEARTSEWNHYIVPLHKVNIRQSHKISLQICILTSLQDVISIFHFYIFHPCFNKGHNWSPAMSYIRFLSYGCIHTSFLFTQKTKLHNHQGS